MGDLLQPAARIHDYTHPGSTLLQDIDSFFPIFNDFMIYTDMTILSKRGVGGDDDY